MVLSQSQLNYISKSNASNNNPYLKIGKNNQKYKLKLECQNYIA